MINISHCCLQLLKLSWRYISMGVTWMAYKDPPLQVYMDFYRQWVYLDRKVNKKHPTHIVHFALHQSGFLWNLNHQLTPMSPQQLLLVWPLMSIRPILKSTVNICLHLTTFSLPFKLAFVAQDHSVHHEYSYTLLFVIHSHNVHQRRDRWAAD